MMSFEKLFHQSLEPQMFGHRTIPSVILAIGQGPAQTIF
jgi:hypothetical protein